jgi:FMN-dependent NADH-azoreductase
MVEPARGASERSALLVSEALIAELAAADLVVIDTPMHNFTVPSALKAWIDHVVRPSCTFRITPAGKVGLLRDRPVLVVVTCGGRFAGPGAQDDFLAPYFRYVLGTIGISSVELLRLEGLGRGAAQAEQALDDARRWIETKVPTGRI